MLKIHRPLSMGDNTGHTLCRKGGNMTLEADKETVRCWITGMWDEGSPEVFAELASADYVYRAPGQEDQRGEAVL